VARDVPADLDVVHHPLTVPIPRPAGVPAVVTIHDLQHHEMPELFSRGERAFRRWAYDGSARSADAVITVSEHARQGVVGRLGVDPERVHAIPHGIDHARFNPMPGDADERLRPRLPERFVAYPANLWPHKNHERLVEAFARVGDRELALVLTGQDYGRLDRLRTAAARAGVGDRVVHLGYLRADEVPALLRAAEAMVFPSLYEGFGAPPLEAMACGCPVAASRAGSLAETVGDAALAMDARSADSIASAIERVTGDEELRDRLRAAGTARAARFSWVSAARRHREVYELAGARG
jgi:glycosyltransferase involved in cell wall biosynthesis